MRGIKIWVELQVEVRNAGILMVSGISGSRLLLSSGVSSRIVAPYFNFDHNNLLF